MNRHGQRFIALRNLRAHANSLNVKRLGDDELEFYEQHCLLLPAVVRRQPIAHLNAATQRNSGGTVENPEDLKPPEAWLRLQRPHADGLHPYDAEREHNPLLLTPDCATFEPWDADDKVTVTTRSGRAVQQRTVERFYSPWQVHIVALLRQQKYYYDYSRFLRHIDPSHDLWRRHRPPENTEWARSLRGMATGFEALERFLFAEQAALEEAFDGVESATLPEPTAQRLDATVTAWARQSLEISDLDEPEFFRFLRDLALLIDDYRDDERVALAEDTEDYLRDAHRLAGYAFNYDWDGFLEASEEHVGTGLSTQLRRFDPLEAAASEAKENLKAILGHNPLTAIASEHGDPVTVPDEIVQFCLDHDLLEVLYGLQHYSYTSADQRRDRYPGFLHRRLRPLALSGEQLARGILDTQAERGHEESSDQHRSGYRGLVKILGKGSSWLAPFSDLKTSDSGQGDLDKRAVFMAETAHTTGATRDDIIANTLGATVATRNLVSHRHRFLSSREARTLAGPCADAVALIWLTAREKGLV